MTIIPYEETYRDALTELFINYWLIDLKIAEDEPRITPTLLKTRLVPHILGEVASGAVRADIALEEGELIAFSLYQIDNPNSDWNHRPGWGFVREFCVAKEHRGKGVGKALAKHTEEQLLGMGAEKLYLTTHSASEFWSACGFTDTGEPESNGNTVFTKYA